MQTAAKAKNQAPASEVDRRHSRSVGQESPDEYTPHRFNPDIATVYGINSALVYQFINFRSCEQRHRGKSKWVDLTIDELCKQYPYFGRKQVWAALQNLIYLGKKTPPLILRKKIANAFLYAPVAEDDSLALHFFDVKVAKKFGVVPAIICQNVGYWITKNWKDKAELLYRMLNPEEFNFNDREMQEFAYDNTRMSAGHFETIEEWVTKRHPYLSQRTARRGFSCLQKAGWLGFRRIKRGKPMWFFTKKLMNDYMQNMLEMSDLENVEAKRKQVEAKKECLAAKRKCVEAKRKHEPVLSDEPTATCKPLIEAVVNEAVGDCRSKVSKAFDDFASRSASGSDLGFATPEAPGKPLPVEKLVRKKRWTETSRKALSPDQMEDQDVEDQVGDQNSPEEEESLSADNEMKEKHWLKAHPDKPEGYYVSRKDLSEIRKLNRPNFPAVKSKIMKDAFGNPVNRKYTRALHPDDPDFLERLEMMSEAERQRYLASVASPARG